MTEPDNITVARALRVILDNQSTILLALRYKAKVEEVRDALRMSANDTERMIAELDETYGSVVYAQDRPRR